MFDVGFWELVIIMIVALLVVGPERLPRLARTVGLWVGKAQSFVRTVKADIDRELATEELRRTLAKQAQIPELQELVDEVKTGKPTQQVAAPAQEPEPLIEAAPNQTPAAPGSSTTSTDKPHDGTT